MIRARQRLNRAAVGSSNGGGQKSRTARRAGNGDWGCTGSASTLCPRRRLSGAGRTPNRRKRVRIGARGPCFGRDSATAPCATSATRERRQPGPAPRAATTAPGVQPQRSLAACGFATAFTIRRCPTEAATSGTRCLAHPDEGPPRRLIVRPDWLGRKRPARTAPSSFAFTWRPTADRSRPSGRNARRKLEEAVRHEGAVRGGDSRSGPARKWGYAAGFPN